MRTYNLKVKVSVINPSITEDAIIKRITESLETENTFIEKISVVETN